MKLLRPHSATTVMLGILAAVATAFGSARFAEDALEDGMAAAISSSRSAYDDFLHQELALSLERFVAARSHLLQTDSIPRCEAIDDWMSAATGLDWRPPLSEEEFAFVQDANLLACRDPFVAHLFARACVGSDEVPKAMPMLEIAAKFLVSPKGREIDPLVRLRMLLQCREWSREMVGRDLALATGVASDRALAEAIADLVRADGGDDEASRVVGSPAWWRGRIAFRTVWGAVESLSATSGSAPSAELLGRLAALDGLDPWMREGLEVQRQLLLARDARGGAWASDTAPERFEAAARHFATLERHAHAAWAIDPTRPEVPTLAVAGAIYGDGFASAKPWFLKAISASADWLPAYEALTLTLAPRWGGSRRRLVDFALMCDRVAPRGGPMSGVPHVVARTLVWEGMSPREIVADPSFGPLLVRSMDEAVSRAKIRGWPDETASIATIALVYAVLREDWESAARYRAVAPFLHTHRLPELHVSELEIRDALRIHSAVVREEPLREEALAAEREGRWADAAGRWRTLAGTLLMRLKEDKSLATPAMAINRRAARCQATAELLEGKTVALSQSVTTAVLDPQACVMTAKGARIALESDVQQTATYRLSPFLASLDLPLGDSWEITGSFDTESLPRAHSDSAIGFAVAFVAGVGAYAHHAAVALRPGTRVLELTTSEIFPEASLASVDAARYFDGKTLRLRIRRHGQSLTAALAVDDGPFETIWSGALPDGILRRPLGGGAGLWASTALGSEAVWRDVSVRRLPAVE